MNQLTESFSIESTCRLHIAVAVLIHRSATFAVHPRPYAHYVIYIKPGEGHYAAITRALAPTRK